MQGRGDGRHLRAERVEDKEKMDEFQIGWKHGSIESRKLKDNNRKMKTVHDFPPRLLTFHTFKFPTFLASNSLPLSPPFLLYLPLPGILLPPFLLPFSLILFLLSYILLLVPLSHHPPLNHELVVFSPLTSDKGSFTF